MMVNEKYLATDLEPLKEIGDGKVLEVINNLLNYYNEDNEKTAELAAYNLKCDYKIVDIYCLFKSINGLEYRRFTYYPTTKSVDDDLMQTAKYGLGIHYVELERYMKLRDFYLEKTNEHVSI
jgi:hypothetical protein